MALFLCPKGHWLIRAMRGGVMQRLALLPGKGDILSRERISPLDPQENARGVPLDPDIAGLQLEELHALRSVGAVYMASP